MGAGGSEDKDRGKWTGRKAGAVAAMRAQEWGPMARSGNE